MAEIIKSIEIIDDASALEEFEEQIRKKKFTVYQVGNRVLYAIGDSAKERESLNEVLEENAFILNLDYARVKLVYLDKSAGKTAESKSLIEQFSSENDVEDVEDGIPVSLLPELIDYIGDNPALVEEDISGVFDTAAGSAEPDAEIIEKEQESPDTPDEDDEFIDDVGEVQEQAEEKENETSEETSDEPEEVPEKELENRDHPLPENKEKHKKKSAKDFKIPEISSEIRLWEKAVAIFDTHQLVRLPKFDELTHKELQEQLLESHFTVSKARDKAIDKIFERLKNETAESAQTIKDQVLKKAKKDHDDNIKKIENNYKSEVEKLLNEHNAEYEREREEFVQAQIPVIRKQYDAKHQRTHQSIVSLEIEKLQKSSAQLMARERQQYQKYVDKVLSDSKEQVISSVRVDDVIEAYNKVAEEQKELLLLQAKSKKKEIGLTLSEIVKERDLLKEQINDYQSKMEKQKQSEQERIESGVSAAIQAKEQQILQESKAEVDKALEREKELLRQIEQLEKNLASEKENKESMKREYIVPAADEVAAASELSDNQKNNRKTFEESSHESGFSKFGKIKFILGSALSLTFLLLFAFGVFTLSDIKAEMSKSNYIDQSSYLTQLQSDGYYDRAASEMKKLGYSDERIAEMYLDNGAYLEALETDSAILSKVYEFIAKTEELEEQKKILENVRDSGYLDEIHQNGLEVRLAMLDEDTENVIALTENTEKVDGESVHAAATYLIGQKSFDPADKLIKSLEDDELAEELSQAREKDLTQKIDALNEEIKTLTKEQAEAVENGEKLQAELKKIKKDDDKAKKKKEDEIKANTSKQKELENTLTEKETELAELKKQL